jgi:tRNA U55 pseudouridine synthase TruB
VWYVQGQAVGSAAHLVALRREAIGKYNVKDAWTVDQLQATFGAPKHAIGIRPKASAVASDGNALKSDEVQHDIN